MTQIKSDVVSDGSTIEELIQRWRKPESGDLVDIYNESGNLIGMKPSMDFARQLKCAKELEAALSSDPSSRVRKEEKAETRVEPLKAGAAPTRSTAASHEPSPSLILRNAIGLYCRWFDTGKPDLEPSSVAYELVSACRQALAGLPSEQP